MGSLRHEIPTHLNVADRAFYGLSVRQVLSLAGGFALGYALWNQWAVVPVELRGALAITCASLALAFALVRPMGRGLEAWAVVVARYLLLPKRAVWSPPTGDRAIDRRHAARWVALAPRPRVDGEDA